MYVCAYVCIRMYKMKILVCFEQPVKEKNGRGTGIGTLMPTLPA